MTVAYDKREGLIWMDGKLINWKDANVHILTHAMHYASSVFEGEIYIMEKFLNLNSTWKD